MRPEQMQFLESINADLRHSLTVASQDFIEVNDLIKKHYLHVKQDKIDTNCFTVDQTRIEAMIGGLQYMDVFSQRVEHLIVCHQRMMNNDLGQDFAESYFHLHVFHAMTIELDLLKSIGSIKALLEEEKNYLNGIGRVNWTDQVFFSHISSIKFILKNTIDRLREAGGDTNKLPIPALSDEHVRILNSLYTMESERIVLSWFLQAMPHGTWEDLHQFYAGAIYQVNEENTELF